MNISKIEPTPNRAGGDTYKCVRCHELVTREHIYVWEYVNPRRHKDQLCDVCIEELKRIGRGPRAKVNA